MYDKYKNADRISHHTPVPSAQSRGESYESGEEAKHSTSQRQQLSNLKVNHSIRWKHTHHTSCKWSWVGRTSGRAGGDGERASGWASRRHRRRYYYANLQHFREVNVKRNELLLHSSLARRSGKSVTFVHEGGARLYLQEVIFSMQNAKMWNYLFLIVLMALDWIKEGVVSGDAPILIPVSVLKTKDQYSTHRHKNMCDVYTTTQIPVKHTYYI